MAGGESGGQGTAAIIRCDGLRPLSETAIPHKGAQALATKPPSELTWTFSPNLQFRLSHQFNDNRDRIVKMASKYMAWIPAESTYMSY
jgi:hypothetical protein